MHRLALYTAIACISWTSALQAQTVDPSEYFPLEVGNEWEYEHELVRPSTEDRPVDESETRVERYRILSSATAQDTLWYDVAYEERTTGGFLIRRDTVRIRYDEDAASVFGADHLLILSWPKCLDGAEREGTAGLYCWPFVGDDEVYMPDVLGPDLVESRSFANFVWAMKAVPGVGIVSGGGGCEPCSPFDDRDDYTLRFARVGDAEYGARIVQRAPAPNLPSRESLSVFPNPAAGHIHVDGIRGVRLRVFDMLGRRVFETHIPDSGSRIDLSALPPGIYLLSDGERSTRLVMK